MRTATVLGSEYKWEGEPVEPWMDEGACVGADPESFFPPIGGGNVRQAKAVCATCPVIEVCLGYALSNSIAFGVWGGRSEHERRQMRTAHNAGTRGRARRRRDWTPEEDARLAALVGDGESNVAIGRELQRDPSVVRSRRSVLGLGPSQFRRFGRTA